MSFDFRLWLFTQTTDPWLWVMLLFGLVSLHPIERIVNVHWDDTLAVIFGEQLTDAPEQEE